MPRRIRTGDLVQVIAGADRGKQGKVIAIDAEKGDQVWRMERIGDRACYSTPCVFQPKYGPAEIIFTHSFRGITGVELSFDKVYRWHPVANEEMIIGRWESGSLVEEYQLD